MTTRRHVLALLAAGPVAACSSKLPDPYAAWRDPGLGQADLRLYGLAHAILAPNPHNQQPWLIELLGDDEMRVFADLDRLLPETDPYDRQITLGCGAFLENFALALQQRDFLTAVTLFPDGEPQPRLDRRPVAHVKLVGQQGIAHDPLYASITARRTNRLPFAARDVPEADLQKLVTAAQADGLSFGTATSGKTRDDLRMLAWDAFDRESHSPGPQAETAHLIRVGSRAIAEHGDGIAVKGFMPEVAAMFGLVSEKALADPENAVTKPGLEAFRPLALEAPAFVWMKSGDNLRATQIKAGRAYARLNLAATAQGLAMHPWSQALQEYPEMRELKSKMESIVGAAPAETVQMLVRVGYGEAVPPSARRPLLGHVLANRG